MRASTRLAPLAICTAALAAGCGAGGSPANSHNVSVSISAPTSGATVAVRQVTVAGNVSPSNARVLVNGQAATVSGGSYKRTLYVSAPQQTITVTGQASGYHGGQASTTINYSPSLAAQLSAAASRLKSPSTRASAHYSPVGQNALQAAVSLSSAGPKSSRHSAPKPSQPSGGSATGSGSGSSSGGGSSSGSGTGSSGSGTTPSGGSSGSGSSGGSSGSGSNPTPTSPAARERAAIKKAYLGLCQKSEKGKKLQPYCRCMYTHLEASGALSSNARLRRLRKEMGPYYRTHNVNKLPKVFRRALNACASKLPPSDPIRGKTTINNFPGQGSVPFSGS